MSNDATGPATSARTPADQGVRVVQCATCGVERRADGRPELCPICVDERQYLPADGHQRWVDPEDFTGSIELVEREPGLVGIDVADGVGIGQQAKVIVTAAGNVMVDVPSAIDADAIAAVRALGPMRAIIASHPHMYGVQSLWSRALSTDGLGPVTVYVSEADAHWLGIEPEGFVTWSGSVQLVDGVTASQPGGHFAGSAVIHFTAADGVGVVLAGDTIFVNPDRRSVSFMRSYPNRIPLSGDVARRIADHIGRYDYDRLYSNFVDHLDSDAKATVLASARRHAAWARGDFDHLTGEG